MSKDRLHISKTISGVEPLNIVDHSYQNTFKEDAFDKEEVKFQKIDDEKQLVLGPILIPNKRILRVDGEGNTYHVFLKESTIEQLAQKYLKNKYTDAVTVEHEQRVDDVVLVESWIS